MNNITVLLIGLLTISISANVTLWDINRQLQLYRNITESFFNQLDNPRPRRQ